MIFAILRKIDNFDPFNVFLAITTNIPQRLKTGFVLQGHICVSEINKSLMEIHEGNWLIELSL